MRREVTRLAMTAALIALAVLALPLGFSIHRLVADDERGELERAALRAAVRVDPGFAAGDPAELPTPEAGTALGLYDAVGRLRAGTGPATADPVTRLASTGAVARGQVAGLSVVAVPTSDGEVVTGAVRAASATTVVWRRTVLGWAGLAALMAAALLAALVIARRRARRLAAPLERLAAASLAIGGGAFGTRVPDCGIAEIDRMAATQHTMADRLGGLLERERQFTANASHQLRTPLAGLQLGLEAARTDPGADLPAALDEALGTARRLQTTVEDVLALHRAGSGAGPDGTSPGTIPPWTSPTGERPQRLDQVLDEVAARWHGTFAARGRVLSHDCEDQVTGRPLPSARVGQILDVLLDNASRHGSGEVRLSARAAGPATAIAVSDEGPGIDESLGDVFGRGEGAGNGIGLSLAREFAGSLGGRLVLSVRTPPTFTLLLPNPDGPASPVNRFDAPDGAQRAGPTAWIRDTEK